MEQFNFSQGVRWNQFLFFACVNSKKLNADSYSQLPSRKRAAAAVGTRDLLHIAHSLLFLYKMFYLHSVCLCVCVCVRV